MTVYTVHCKECGDLYTSTIKARADDKCKAHIKETAHPTWVNKKKSGLVEALP